MTGNFFGKISRHIQEIMQQTNHDQTNIHTNIRVLGPNLKRLFPLMLISEHRTLRIVHRTNIIFFLTKSQKGNYAVMTFNVSWIIDDCDLNITLAIVN